MAALSLFAGCGDEARRKNEECALVDVKTFAYVAQRFAGVNRGGFVEPSVMIEAYAKDGSLPGLPRRFAGPERCGYRFEFEGYRLSRDPARMYLVVPAYDGFAYTAVPIDYPLGGRRTFTYMNNELFYVFEREDGLKATKADHAIPLDMDMEKWLPR